MVKKLTALLFAFGYLVLSPVYAYAATLSVAPPTGQINKGCDVTFTIELDTQGAQTDGTDVILSYNPAVMTIAQTDITNGKIYADYPGNSVDATAGKISVSGIAQVSEAFSGKGTFATLKFKVNSAASGNATLKFDFDPNNKTNSTDSNVVERGTVADVLSAVTDGSYTVGTGSCAAGVGAPGASSLPISNPVASGGSLPTSLPEAGILDNTVLVASVGMLLIVLGIVGIAAL
jgi:hypothetical protein